MDESRKSAQHFNEFERSILTGSVLDIGAGKDPVVSHAKVFDLAQGDANHITRFVKQSFDCVYSSHCLEHMRAPREALEEWWQLVKPGGYLFFIVPDEDLYEQGVFPSRFNGDHKHSFTIAKKKSWSPASINLLDLIQSVPQAEVVSIRLNDINFDRRYVKHGPYRTGFITRFFLRQIESLRKRGLNFFPSWFLIFLGRRALLDQTRGEALAQIEVVLKKQAE